MGKLADLARRLTGRGSADKDKAKAPGTGRAPGAASPNVSEAQPAGDSSRRAARRARKSRKK